MGKIAFTKMHGLGNCYIYVDFITNPYRMDSLPDLAQKVSNPNTGIGADGMILILPSEKADLRMRVFNKDGSEAKNCGNGLRCVAKFAYEHKLVDKTSFLIETLGGLVEAHVHLENETVDQVTVDMGEPHLERQEIPMAGTDSGRVIEETLAGIPDPVTGVSMGNPHGIFFFDDIEKAPLHELGRTLADHHPIFPEGVNVGVVEMLNPHEMQYRVWERGSGITQACGTGACAAVVAAALTQRAPRDEEVTVHLAGGDLWIRWSKDGRVWMRGPAAYICSGEFYL